ncbi:MAG: hypothetical protein AB7F86_17670 [Bdellovibrionales bacterium]
MDGPSEMAAYPRFADLRPNVSPVDAPLSGHLEQIFLALNQVAFGGSLFKLQACDGCLAAADLSQRVVFIDPGFVDRLGSIARTAEERDLFLEFVMAHELGHYIFELAAQANGYSTKGNPSYRLLRDSGFRCDQNRQESHAEVDEIGLNLLKKRGWPRPERALARLLRELNFACDGKLRATRMSSHP